ncbi:hypothetical protein MAPG_08364 [Magnaporthiopsis poae ATCC 64411]|uniref:Uncharacterized protein n=1 Tax=Magnaporthiopsis poae (strain ATCC 64411 / 73-15) TaxID=644358 RepID=A0A0C4E762_MAGP6|nr:hypothetical protein MAPG_08364 [Magnaporthiopsis poae ATCC 64411]
MLGSYIILPAVPSRRDPRLHRQALPGLLLCREEIPRPHTPANIETSLQRRRLLLASPSYNGGLRRFKTVSPSSSSPWTALRTFLTARRRRVATLRVRIALRSCVAWSSCPLRDRVRAPAGRHDNDHHDISQIKIYPTVDEVLSTRGDFLPSTGIRQPDFYGNPVQPLPRHTLQAPPVRHVRPLIDFLH